MNKDAISSENMNKELAYLFGVYLGDGHISVDGVKNDGSKYYKFELSSIDKDFVEFTLNCVKKINSNCNANIYVKYPGNFLLDGKKYKRQKVYRIGCGFTEYASLFKEETNNKHHIPYLIWNASLDIKRWFVAGIMDSDGWISHNCRKDGRYFYSIGVGQVEEGWIWEFKSLLQQMGVSIYKPQIRKKDGRKPFVQLDIRPITFVSSGLFFVIKRKQDKLKKFIDVQRLDAAHPKG